MRALPSITDPDALLTEVQAATFLNLSTRTLQAWRTQQKGPPYVQAGRAIRYRRRALVAWMDANTVLSNPPVAPRKHVSKTAFGASLGTRVPDDSQ